MKKKTAIHKTIRGIRKINLSGAVRLLIFASALLQLTGCVKDDLYNTPHPDRGAVTVTADWSGRSPESVVPDSYILRIGTEEQTVSGETNAFNALFLPGSQDLLAYNLPDGITAGGTTATVNALPDGTLDPLPGYLFSAAQKLEIVKDDTLRVTLPMRQRVRELILDLKLKPGDGQRIASTSATLAGIASAIDLATGAITSTEGKSVVPVFTMAADGSGTRLAGQTPRASGQPMLTATLRLMGVMPEERQLLALTLTLTDGYVKTIPADLTELLRDFDTGGDLPMELDADLELPAGAGMNAAISDWTVVDNGDVEVH